MPFGIKEVLYRPYYLYSLKNGDTNRIQKRHFFSNEFSNPIFGEILVKIIKQG
jgi:hypothetical protein